MALLFYFILFFNFQRKQVLTFHVNHMLGRPHQVPHQDASNEFSQQIFSWRPLLSAAMSIIQGYCTDFGEYCPELGYRRTGACEGQYSPISV